MQALLWTVGSLVFPWPLTPVRDLHAVPLTGLLAGLLVLLGGPLLLRWRKAPALGWAGFALVVAAPLLALPPTLHGYLAAERYAYPGLVGFAALVAALAPALPAPSRPMAMALLGPALLLHLLLAGRWADDRQLFSDAVDALPESAYAWHFLGQAEALAGDPAAAAVAFGEACARPHAHPLDRRLRLQALVLSGQATEAVAWAEAGPQEGLAAEDIAWWARAARDAGQPDDARRLLSMLREEGGWAGPDWVPALARDLGI